MKKLFIFIILILISSTLSAENPKWFKGKIKAIYPQSSGDFIIMFYEDNLGCTNGSTDKHHYVKEGENGLTREGVRALLSTTLAAASTGKEVNINFDADSSSCFINRLFISF